MSSIQLHFTALTCALFGSLLPIYSTHTGWVSCHADYDIVSYQPPQSHFVGAPIDNPPVLAASPGAKIGALMQSHDAYRKQLSYPGYRTRSSSDIAPVTSAPSSGLPAGFRDDFSAPWFYRERSAQYFKHQFDAKLRRLGLQNQPEHARAYERAEMRRWWLYASCEFRDFLKELPVYQEYIVEIAAELARDKQFAAAVTRACDADSVEWIHAEAYRIGCNRRAREIQQELRQKIHDDFTQQQAWFDNDTRMFYEGCAAFDDARFIKRAHAEQAIKRGGAQEIQQWYTISRGAVNLLNQLNIQGRYQGCYGNQLQQVIHQECIDLIERTAQLESTSPIFEYQSTLAYCIDAAQTYNKVGYTYNATAVTDFCYTLLDYGKAVLEGTRDGLVSVAQQAVNDPLQTIASATLSVAASEYLLAYQLGKLVYGVLNLTVNAVINPEQAQKTWDGYIAPISSIIDALNNKQLSLRDGIRAGTALAVNLKAQSMLAKGCEKLYSVAKTRALNYIAQTPRAYPEQYTETPEGSCFSIISESTKKKNLSNIPEASSKELLGKLSDHALQKALDYAKIENNFKHYFDEKHNLGGLIDLLGSKENVLRAVFKSAAEYLPASGVFVDIPIKVANVTVWIRGRVMNGVPKLSTIFIR